MVKYCIEKYPMGSFKKQQSAGKYIDGTLYENIKILAKNIIKDMTYLGVIYSSTLEVGAGKSLFAQHFMEAYFELVNKYHGMNLNITEQNIVFRPDELIKRSFEVPRFSGVILDEWEDAHYWSKLGISLRQFFRKCRQLNLLIIVIIPNFFQLPSTYAISRSVFAIDVWFSGEFDRGFFSFYNFNRKRDLYLKGKKNYNYKVVKSNFSGRFTDGYAIDGEVYRKMKYLDMLKEEQQEKKKEVNVRDINKKIYSKLREKFPKILLKEWKEIFDVSERTLNKYSTETKTENTGTPDNEVRINAQLINILSKKNIIPATPQPLTT